MTTKTMTASVTASRSLSRSASARVCRQQQLARPLASASRPAASPARTFASSRQPRFLNDLAKILGEAAPRGSSSSQPTRFKDSKVLNYTPSELYAIVSDVDSYSEFLPFCTESKVISPAPEDTAGAGSAAATSPPSPPTKRIHAQLGVGFKSFRERYTSLVEMKEAEWVAASALPHHLFQHLSTRWNFVPLSQHSDAQPSTRIDFSLDYAFTSPLYNAVAGGIFAELSKRMMVSFEERATALYGTRR